MNQNNPRFVYIREDRKGKKRKSVITVAYRFDDEGKRIAFNYAQCSTVDPFSKAMGRRVAEGRLMVGSKEHPVRYIPYSQVSEEGSPDNPRYALITAAIIGIINNEKLS